LPLPLFFTSDSAPPALHSFPTRRSSDLVPAEENPGLVLGTILGLAARRGMDKLTLFASPGLHDLGAWLEQLLAESTGKEGKGIIDRKSTRLNSSHEWTSYAVFCLKKKRV